MSMIQKLEGWVAAHPTEANEPFMNITSQRKFTLNELLAALKEEEQTGVAIVDEGLVELRNNVSQWLQ